MRTTDKVLIGIVVGAALLAGGAFAAILLRPEPTYTAGGSPEGVVHNYLLALQRGDYDRAYANLSPNLSGYPRSAQQFQQQLEDSYLLQGITESSLTVGAAAVDGQRATVVIREAVFYGGGLFENSQSITTFEADLARVGGEWKITDSDRYFLACWSVVAGC